VEANVKSQRGRVDRGIGGTRQGFTVIELLMVLTIVGVMSMMALPRMGSYMSKREAVNARDAFLLAAGRARSAAVERGEVVVLRVAPSEESVVVTNGSASDTIHVLDLKDGDMRADIVSATAIRVCYVPRGYAHPSCGSGSDLPLDVGFAGPGDTVWATIKAAGQVERK
jgi:prepilin-type N-terminal cleavage/methylation domain-containing protein